MDTIQPTLYVLNGVQQYASVDKPHLKTIGWFDDNPEAVYRALRGAGVAMVDQFGKPAEGEERAAVGRRAVRCRSTSPPRSRPGCGTSSCPTSRSRSTTATRPAGRCRRPREGPARPRAVRLPHAAHRQPAAGAAHAGRRARRHRLPRGPRRGDRRRRQLRGPRPTRCCRSRCPTRAPPPTPTGPRTAPNDTYHSLTFKVADLDRAAEHLKSQGVGIRSRTEDFLVTDPDTSINVPWGFTTHLVPGDPRA